MLRFLSNRLARANVTTFLVRMIAFATPRLSRTSFEFLYPEGITAGHFAALEGKYGLDRPWAEHLWTNLTDMAQGDFGRSLYTKKRV